MAKPLKRLGTNVCPKCTRPMERRSHKQPPKKPFYFSEWDYCPKCKHLQHYDKFKVVQAQKPVHPLMRKMLADLLPGLRYAVNRLRDRGNSSVQIAALEWDIARIKDGHIPSFLEWDEPATGGR